jgi:hypothetical protein
LGALVLVCLAGAFAASSSVFPINSSFTLALLFISGLLGFVLLLAANRKGNVLSIVLAALVVLGSAWFGNSAAGVFQADGRIALHSDLISKTKEQCETIEGSYSKNFEKETLQDVFPGSNYTFLGESGNLPWEPNDNGELLYLESISDNVYLVASSERESAFNTWFYLLESHRHTNGSKENKLTFLGNPGGMSVTDIRRSESLGSNEVYAVHMNGRAESMTLDVSILSFEPIKASVGLSKEIFSTKPEISSLSVASSGGRFLIQKGKGYLTVGDFSYGVSDMASFTEKLQNGETRNLPQGLGATYQIDLDSYTYELFSTGHRNQQGLAADRWGRIWSTEHGPLGGSEVNLLSQGGFYGWPETTLGKPYDGFEKIQEGPGYVALAGVIPNFGEQILSYWCNPGGNDTIEPKILLSGPLNFVPSEVVFVGDGEDQKMIIGTLAGESLLVSTVNSSGISDLPVKVIRLGERVRDLVVTTDGGSLLLTNDSREIFRIDLLASN